MDFKYNEETRIHTLGGKVIPSVSQVISPLSDFSKIPKRVLERKTELGTQFHDAIHAHIENDLLFDSLDPDLIKPMETFVEWFDILRLKSLKSVAIEKSYCHERLRYCGKPDLISTMAIFDWKLRPYMPVVDTLKLEAYQHMVSRKKLDLWTICFDLEGKIKMYDSRDPKAWGIFRKMLERYNSELEFNQLMDSWKGVA